MKRSAIRRIFRGLLAVSVALPFFAFSKETLAAFGGPLVWLLGYPLLVVITLAATAGPRSSKRIHATSEQADKCDTEEVAVDDELEQLSERINNPGYSFLSCNIHHRD